MKRPRRKSRRTWSRLHPSPSAVALDGTVFASVGLFDDTHDAESAVREATALRGRVFVGVELGAHEVSELHRWLDDSSYECLAFALGTRRRRKGRRRKRDGG